MAKAKRSIAEASSELFNLLEPFEPAERTRIVVGTLTLLGDPVPAQVSSQGGGGGTSGTDSGRTPAPPAATGGARAYLDGKAPKGTSELLATAARFHELNNAGAAPTKESFAAIIHTQGRRNFQGTNFTRDIDNAQKAGYFNGGGSAKSGYPLSNVGQDYVDALPDRAAALAIRRTGRGANRKLKRKGKTPPKK